MGRTASGKDFLVHKLCERAGLKQIISYTTRDRRKNEGETHHFVTKEDYEDARAKGSIAAYTEIAGNLYWTTIDQLYDNDVYIIDPLGLETLQDLNLPNLRLVTVYVNTPDEVRKDRALNQRKDDKFTFMKRDLDERQQFREMLKNTKFDYAVSNLDGAKAYSVLRWIATVEGIWKGHQVDNAE